MCKLAVLMFLSALCSAQTITMTLTGPATVRPGANVTLSLAASATGPDTGAAGLQWKITLPASITATAAIIGPTGTAAAKAISCTTDNTLCLVTGSLTVLNSNKIGNGSVTTYTIKVAANATAGTVQLPLTGLISADPSGLAILTQSGAVYSLIILASQDIDGNGTVDRTDVTLMLGQVIAGTCSNDQNGDGVCDVRDVQVVIAKALGQ